MHPLGGGFDFARHILPRRRVTAVGADFGAHRFFVAQIAVQIERFALAAQVIEVAALDRFIDLLVHKTLSLRFIGQLPKRQFHAPNDEFWRFKLRRNALLCGRTRQIRQTWPV